MDEAVVASGSTFDAPCSFEIYETDKLAFSLSGGGYWLAVRNFLFHVLPHFLHHELHRPCQSCGGCIFSFLAYGYLLGYLQRIWRERRKDGRREEGSLADRCGLLAGGALTVCVALVLLIQIGTGAVSDSTTGKAIHLIADGEARAYEQEYKERCRLFMDQNVQELVLKPYENRPDMLYVGDFSADPLEPTNVKVAEFFGKNSVRVDYE